MKYILIDEKDGDLFTKEFNNAADAILEAEYEWNRLTHFDQSKRSLFVVVESVNPDEDADNHFDGNIIWRAKE